MPAPIPDQRSVSPGGTVAVNASASNPVAGQTLTYSLGPGAPAGAAINPASGAFTWPVPAGEAPGDYSVTVSVSDNGNPPLSATEMFTIDVLQPTSLAVAPASGTYGTTTALSATLTAGGSPAAGAPVTFILAAGDQATTLGTATTDASGVASLSGVSLAALAGEVAPARRSPLSAATPATHSAPQEQPAWPIGQATPRPVTWAMPADIARARGCRRRQLDAMASVPGTFTYSPAAGTVLPAGMGQPLTAMFIPADSTDYTSASASTALNVLAKPARPSPKCEQPDSPCRPGTHVHGPGDSAGPGRCHAHGNGPVRGRWRAVGSAVALAGGAATSTASRSRPGRTRSPRSTWAMRRMRAPGVAHRNGRGSDRDGGGDSDQPTDHCRPER